MLDIFIEVLNRFVKRNLHEFSKNTFSIYYYCSLSTFNLKPAVAQQLVYFSTLPTLNDLKNTFYYTVEYKSYFLYNLHIMRLTMPTEALSDYLLEPPVTHVPLEQAETCLNIILLLVINANPSTEYDMEMLQEFEILPPELQFVKSLNSESFNELRSELRNSKTLYIALKKLLQIPKYYPEAAKKSYAILSRLTNFDYTLPQLIETAKKQSDEVKSAMTLCVERVLEKQGVKYDCAQLCLEYLIEIANPSQPYCLR